MENEPTYRQHLILKKVSREYFEYKTGKEKNIELYWELVRAGYLKNLCLLVGAYEWKFILTEKADEYLNSL